jgi:hypothetical protein
MSQQEEMQDAIPTPTEPAPSEQNGEPEMISETLYIQNLNEKIKIPGRALFMNFERDLRILHSPQSVVTWFIQIVRGSSGCCSAWKSTDAGAGFCVV